MRTACLLLLASCLGAAALRAALPMQTTFTGAKGERAWTLKELNPDLPSNWTGFEFLVLEFKASSSQRFDLGLETPQGRIAKRIGPFAIRCWSAHIGFSGLTNRRPDATTARTTTSDSWT